MKDRASGPEALSEVLGKLFVSRGWGRLAERAKLESAWAEAAGKDISAQSRVLSLRRGVLEIEVKSGVLLQELAQFHKRKLLQALRQQTATATVADVKFRCGAW